MSKFNTRAAKPAGGKSPVQTEEVASGRTYEGGPGYARTEKSELFLLAVSNMVGEDTFYENARSRDNRYVKLIQEVSIADPVWVADFLGWLRNSMYMRSASIVGAAEFVRTYTARGLQPGDPNPMDSRGPLRRAVDAVLQRADEPGEILAYWTSKYGRRIPKPLKRGVADAVRRLYNERSLLKYDTASHGFRFADVLELVHPQPALDKKVWQSLLFVYALDRRHGRADASATEMLPIISANLRLRKYAESDASVMLDPDILNAAGMTWEDALSLVGSKVSKKALWEAMIPSMGYMALLRNLRNFDEAGVSDSVASKVMEKLANPEAVARSRQLPMRFLSAHRAAPSLRWSYPLEQALSHSLQNIPELRGRTLILVDTSTSMDSAFSKDGTLRRWDAATIFGVALGLRCQAGEVVSFSSSARYMYEPNGTHTKVFPLQTGESLLRAVERWKTGGWFLGGGTDTAGALRRHFDNHTRVVILTDEQANRDAHEVSQAIPANVPLYTWNLAGYRMGHAPGGSNRHTFGGLTDAAFRMIPLLEAGKDQNWPWQLRGEFGRRIDEQLDAPGERRERPRRM